MLRLVCTLLRLLGCGALWRCGRGERAPADGNVDEERERFEARRRLFRQKLREAVDVWRREDAPADGAGGTPGGATADPLED